MFGLGNKDAELECYKKYRSLGRSLNNKIIKTAPKEMILKAGQDLNIVEDDVLVFEYEDEIGYLMDRMIYTRYNAPSILDRFIEQNRSGLSEDENKLLEAMQKAYYSLFLTVDKEASRGLWLEDVFNNQRIFLFDINLSMTAENDYLFASRIITINSVSFTSGVAYVFKKHLFKEMKEYFTGVYDAKKSSMSWGETMNRYSKYFHKMHRKYGLLEEFRHIT